MEKQSGTPDSGARSAKMTDCEHPCDFHRSSLRPGGFEVAQELRLEVDSARDLDGVGVQAAVLVAAPGEVHSFFDLGDARRCGHARSFSLCGNLSESVKGVLWTGNSAGLSWG